MKRSVIKVVTIFSLVVSILCSVSTSTTYSETEYLSVKEASKEVFKSIQNYDKSLTLHIESDLRPSDCVKQTTKLALENNDMPDYYKYSVYKGCNFKWSYRTFGKYRVEYKFKYLTSKSQNKKFESSLRSTVKKLNLKNKSTYNKVKIIHKYITNNVKYGRSKDYTAFSAYSALCKKKAVCQGYSTLFYRMCKLSGVESKVITGVSRGENHAWNIVKIGNKWYNVDSTWDAKNGSSKKTYKYFLKNNKDFKNHERDEEFSSPSFNSSYKMSKRSYKVK